MSFACVEVQDKSNRSADPGQTGRLRIAFNSNANMQLNRLRAQLRQAVIDLNVLGMSSGPANFSFMAPGARLNQFAGWLENAANASLDAKWWVHPWLDRATQHGLKSAQAEMKGFEYQPVPTTFETLHQRAHDELKGIIGAAVQKVMRKAHSVVNTRLTPHRAYRELVKPLDGDIRNRLGAFAHDMTIKGHVHGKVAYYREHGINYVGIDPELKMPKPKYDRALFDKDNDIAEVGVQTAEDDDVCDACEDMADGGPYTLDEITDLIPLHPYCRCEPVIWDDDDNDDYRDSFKDEVEYIRVEGGRFGGSVGHGKSKPVGKTTSGSPPPHTHLIHYSSKTELRGDTIFTSNVYDATRALYEGRKVVLKQPKQVSTLVKHLGQVSARMVEMGGKAPTFDLCRVSIKGTNLFCADTKGIPRIKMPQMSKQQTKEFVLHLIEQGYNVEKDTEKSSHLRATQNQLVGSKVAANVERMKLEPERMKRRLVISRDNYILDGHHKWAAILALDSKNNKIGDLKIRVSRVDIDIVKLLDLATKFTGGKGAKAGDSMKDYDPDEERDWHGRWGGAGKGKSGGTVAYHGTTEEVAQSIIKEGIRIKPAGRSFLGRDHELYEGPRGQSVFVADNETRAIDWAQRRSDVAALQDDSEPHDLVVFKLNIPKDEWDKFKEDEKVPFGAARAEMNIPAKWIVKATGYDAFDVDGENPHEIPLRDAIRDADHVVKYMAVLVAHKRS